jgi:hypothetical protein
MPGKSGRPFSGDSGDLQKRLQNAQNALVELSEQSCGKDQAVARLVELLRSASNEISYLSSRVRQNELPLDIIVIEEAELDATARWYRALDDEDRAELLMEENALEEEYNRFWQWMPRFMAHLARTNVRVQTDTRVPAHPKHANHGHWLKEKRHRLHRLAAQTLKNRSTSCITLFQLAKGIDRFWMHVSTPTHQQDMKLGDDLHHQVIQRVRKQLISWVPRTPYVVMKKIRLILLDNWDMWAGLVHARRKDGEVLKSKMLHAILLREELLDASYFTGSAPEGTMWVLPDESTWDIMKSVPSQAEVDVKLGGYFTGFALMAREDIKLLWKRPDALCDQQATGKSIMKSWPAQTHLKASSKEDMAEVYQWLDDQLPGDYKVVVEDWATFAITWNHMCRSPDLYKYWMVWGGELHRMMHTNDAIIHIYWEHVIKPCAMLLFRIEVKLKFNANDFNNKEQFVRLVAVAAFKWLVQIDGVRDDLLAAPTVLLSQLKANLPAHELVHFLIYAGTFALSDKSAIRTSNCDDLDWAWPYTAVLGRACNKRNYAKYGIQMNKVIHDSHPWVKVMMKHYRTYRKTSRECSGVGKDSGIEDVSLSLMT